MSGSLIQHEILLKQVECYGGTKESEEEEEEEEEEAGHIVTLREHANLTHIVIRCGQAVWWSDRMHPHGGALSAAQYKDRSCNAADPLSDSEIDPAW
jgi:hypothetical protein